MANKIFKSVILAAFAMAAVTNLSAQQQDTVQTDQGNWYVVTRGEKGAVIGMRQIDAPKTTTPKVAPSKEEVDSVVSILQEMLGNKYKITAAAAKDTTTAPAKTISGRQAAMNMAGNGNSKGCFHLGVYSASEANRAKGRVGKMWMSNCNGFEVSAGPEAQYSKASSELGEFTNVIAGARIKAAYKYYWVTPSVSYFKGSNMSIENRSFKSDEFTFAIDVAPWHHWTVSPYVGANYTHRLLRSRKEVSLEGYEMTLPYKGKAGSIGAEAGARIHLGHTTHNRVFSDGEYRYNYEKRGELFLDIQAQYNHYCVEKLKAETVQSNLKVDVVSVNATLVWRLPL